MLTISAVEIPLRTANRNPHPVLSSSASKELWTKLVEYESQSISQLVRSTVERHIEIYLARTTAPQKTIPSLVDLAAEKLVNSMPDQIEEIPDSIVNSNMINGYNLPYQVVRARDASAQHDDSEPAAKRQKVLPGTERDVDEW